MNKQELEKLSMFSVVEVGGGGQFLGALEGSKKKVHLSDFGL